MSRWGVCVGYSNALEGGEKRHHVVWVKRKADVGLSSIVLNSSEGLKCDISVPESGKLQQSR